MTPQYRSPRSLVALKWSTIHLNTTKCSRACCRGRGKKPIRPRASASYFLSKELTKSHPQCSLLLWRGCFLSSAGKHRRQFQLTSSDNWTVSSQECFPEQRAQTVNCPPRVMKSRKPLRNSSTRTAPIQGAPICF